MKIMVQVGIFFGICLIGEAVSVIMPIMVPANMIGMMFLFILLYLQVLNPNQIQKKTNFLINRMAFFFIPSGVSIMNEFEKIRTIAWLILVICILTTIITFGATTFTVRALMHWQNHCRRVKGASSDGFFE